MRALLIASGLIGFAGVAFGAFGAHGLGDQLSSEARGWWETASFYALVHAGPAIAIALSGARARLARLAGWAFALGALVFSGSLYALALTSLGGAPVRMLGAVTPFGGVSLLLGWALLIASGLARGSSNQS